MLMSLLFGYRSVVCLNNVQSSKDTQCYKSSWYLAITEYSRRGIGVVSSSSAYPVRVTQ